MGGRNYKTISLSLQLQWLVIPNKITRVMAAHFQKLKWALTPGTVPKHKAKLGENIVHLLFL